MSSDLGPGRVLIFGSGKLTLGLLAASIDSRLIEVVVCARSTSLTARALKAHGSYILHEGIEARQVDVVEVLFHDNETDRARIRELLRDENTVAVLTSVKDGQRDIATLLAQLLVGRRHGGSELLLIPCENRVDPAMSDLVATTLARRVRLGSTMVDRICLAPEINDDGVVVSTTERFSEWCIQLPSGVTPEPWYGIEGVVLVLGLGAKLVPNINAVHFRKFTMLNGLHASMAAIVMDWQTDSNGDLVDDVTISEYVERIDGMPMLKGLESELAALVAHRYRDDIDEDDIRAWMEIYIQRVLISNQRASEILARYVEGRMSDLLQDFAAKVAAPLEQFEAIYGTARWIRAALQAFGRLIEKSGRSPQA